MWSARRRWRVVIAWVALVVLALFVSSVVSTDIRAESEVGAPGESGEAVDLLEDRFGVEQERGGVQEIVVFEHPSLTVDDPVYRDTVDGLLESLKDLTVETTEVVGGTTVVSSARIVSETTSHYDIGAPREGSPFVAQNETGGDVTFALVDLEGEIEDAIDNIDPVLDAVADFEAAADFEILIGGQASQIKQEEEVLNEDFGFALFLNLPVTFLILILAFGNLRERPFSAIWSDTSEPRMAVLKDRKAYLKGRCRFCRYLDICNGNLRTRAERYFGDFLAPDPGCYLTDEEIGLVPGTAEADEAASFSPR